MAEWYKLIGNNCLEPVRKKTKKQLSNCSLVSSIKIPTGKEYVFLKSLCWSLNLQCNGIWRWSLREEISLRWGLGGGGAVLLGIMSLWEETPEAQRAFSPQASTIYARHRWIHMGTQWGGSSLATKRRGLRMKPSLPAPWSCTFHPPKLWETNCHCWSHQPVVLCDVSLS